MSKVTIKIDPKTGQNYLPRDVRKSGFVGEVEAFGSAVTLTLIRPGARVRYSGFPAAHQRRDRPPTG